MMEDTMALIPDSHKDLLASDVGILATQGKDGHPQVTALWFLFDSDGQIKLSLNLARQKTKNLVEQPECTFFVIDPANPYRTIEVRAVAEISADSDYAFADKLGAKYGGADLRTRDLPGESRVVVVLRPVKVNVFGAPAE
jgi:PPOX class probable F420-dependent enzyme